MNTSSSSVQDLRGNVRLFFPVRPLKSDRGTVGTFFPDSDDAEPSLIKFNDQCFKYSRVLGPEAAQEEAAPSH